MQEIYQKKAIPGLKAQFRFRNVMAVPKIEKAVVNIGIGRVREEKERSEIEKYMTMITGQKPSPRPARTAIAAFKTRKGLIIGYQVTLRGQRMYDFLSRLVVVALPRTRDFRGIEESSFDGRGNMTIGIREHIVFPEMIGEDYKMLFGMEVTVVTSARRREEGIALLKLMGFPIKNSIKKQE